MEAITTLLTQYSIAEVILIILLVAVGFKFVSELFDWFRKRLRDKYDDEEEEEDKYNEISKEVHSLNDSLEGMAKEMVESNNQIKSELSEMKDGMFSINQRLLETTRSMIIDKHHRYVAAGEITDFSLQSLERQYSYYKSAGGNTFIDRLMEDIRKLPVVNSDNAMGKENGDAARTKDVYRKS